jgi:putative membrane protein
MPFSTRTLMCAAMLAAFSASAIAADSQDMFLKDAIQGNMAEVSMGELAQKNGASDAVKDFGRMLAADHSKGRDQTTAIAKKLNIEVPKGPKPDAAAMHTKMSKMQGAEFDKMFASHMVMEHEKEIKMHQEAAKTDPSSDIGKYAADTVPVLQKHLKTAQSLAK